MEQRRRRNRGFTLVELLVVVLVISMLAVFVGRPVLKQLGRAKKDLARPRMAIVEDAINRFSIECGRLPDDSEGLEALLVAPPDLEEKWNGPYLKQSQLLDPWGNPFGYIAEGQYNPGSFDLVCYGADGQEGGEGDNEDVYND